MLKEHPILFSGPMVRAILEGRKTQTRRVKCPHGGAGDRLWVREAFNKDWCGDILYRADGSSAVARGYEKDPRLKLSMLNWRPSIHMPKWASRITLEIVGIRCERVQDITETDAIAEGLCCRDSFKRYWDSLNLSRGFGWDKNPWVWIIEFKRIEHESIV